MAFQPALAAIRFGFGRHPGIADPADAGAVLAQLGAADTAARAFPIPKFATLMPDLVKLADLNKQSKKTGNTPEFEAERNAIRTKGREMAADMLRAQFARAVSSETPFRERLERFWADHFTVKAPSSFLIYLVPSYIEEAVRPAITGRFVDMLKACVMHPAMLAYLDQSQSVGPNSKAALRNPKLGLNENLAREVLELHTLGVGADYSQGDVRELAKIFTGMIGTPAKGFKYQRFRAEPGVKRVLGRKYGGGRRPQLGDIEAVLEDLAAHPATARHLAQKLAVHFVSDQPDPALVEAMAVRYAATEGDLMAVYEVLVTHPAADAPLAKVKQPFDYIASSLRALGVPGTLIQGADKRMTVRALHRPMVAMGQPFMSPIGPDGWPEDTAHWVTPQGLATRIGWAMGLAKEIDRQLPDPRDFVDTALGPLASETLHFAAQAAETKSEGVGIILSSPEFQKR